MKIFFSASNDVTNDVKELYLNIISFIQKTGNDVNYDLIINTDKKTQKIQPIFTEIYEKILRQIDRSEVLLVDISYPSGGVGYQVSYAIHQRKPIIIIYKESEQTNPSVIMRGIRLKNVLIIKYASQEDLENQLTEALKKASKIIKVRFNLVMPNEYFSFIENQSKKLKLSKTSYILNLVKQAVDKE